jgi:predicted phosphohydrolase
MENDKFAELLLGTRQAIEHARNNTTTLSERDAEIFLKEINREDPELTEDMKKAIRKHNEMVD